MSTEAQRRLLGAFVRARREGLAPEGHGRRRRTPGLRREELAARAAIGTTWVAWIEQGREVHPSAETLGRLAGALSLSPAERDYLFSLAGRRDPADPFAAPREAAPPAITAAVAALPFPAYALDPAWSVCAANAAARRLFAGLFDSESAPNLLRYVFTHPAARTLLPDWQTRAMRLLAEFRRDYGRVMADPRVAAVLEWLQNHCPEFRAGWESQSVLAREGGARDFLHPEDGLLHFTQHTLADVEREDFRLVFLEPAEGGSSTGEP